MADEALEIRKKRRVAKEESALQSRRAHPVIGAIFAAGCILIVLAVSIYYLCGISEVYVEGNSLYTKEEIADYVVPTEYSDSLHYKLRHNVVFLSFLSLLPGSNRIAFVESVKVRPVGYNSVRIAVEEKELDGYIPYAGRNIYFTADGIAQEISPMTVTGVTYISGLDISDVVVGRKIQSEDENKLAQLLEAMQTLAKYDLKADSLLIADNGNIGLFFDRVEIDIGRSDYELKISKISQIYPYLEGRSGTIDLTNYDSAEENIILK